MTEAAPYSAKLLDLLRAGRHVSFIHAGGPCTSPGRHFATLEDCEGLDPDITLAELMRRPCRVCGSKAWAVDVYEPQSPLVGGFGSHGHGGT